MIIKAYKAKAFFWAIGATALLIIGLIAYTVHLRTVLENTTANLTKSEAQIEFLQEEKRKIDVALAREIREATALRRETTTALDKARQDEEYKAWAPQRLPQITIDEFRKPE